MNDAKLSFAFEVSAQVGTPLDLGIVPAGRRRIVPILGGTLEGSGLKARIQPGGADWQVIRADGFTELDVRYTLETDDGKLIYVQNVGIRHASPEATARLLKGEPVDPALVYFRTVPKFETSAPELAWLMRSIFVAVGQRHPAEVVMQFWKLE